MGFSESNKGKGLINAGNTSHEHNDKDPNRPKLMTQQACAFKA